MDRQPLRLAALAAAAVPGLAPVSAEASPDDPADFSTAVVVDGEGQRWRVRSPRTPEAGIRLETELQVLAGLTPAVRAGLPFRIERIEDAGRHRIVRGRVGAAAFNLTVPEGEPIPAGADRVVLDPARIGVFVDDWRIAPLTQASAA